MNYSIVLFMWHQQFRSHFKKTVHSGYVHLGCAFSGDSWDDVFAKALNICAYAHYHLSFVNGVHNVV